jgi:hypothetical protein
MILFFNNKKKKKEKYDERIVRINTHTHKNLSKEKITLLSFLYTSERMCSLTRTS